MAGRSTRWAVAVLVTGGVFVAVTWVSGAALLPLWIKDDGIRWLIATAAGLALSGSAALWGKSYATARQEPPAAPAPAGVTASGARSIAVGGELTGIAFTGDGTRIDRHVERSSNTCQGAHLPLEGP